MLLEAKGVEVKECSSGIEGIKALETDSYDLVISDINMNDGDGNYVLKQMSLMGLKTPLYLFSNDLKLQKITYPYYKGRFEKMDFKLLIDNILKMKLDLRNSETDLK